MRLTKRSTFTAALWVALGTLLASCDAGPPPGVVATFAGGEITIADVEEVILALPPERRLAREASIVETYREVTRRLALSRILAPGLAEAEEGYAVRREEMPEAHRAAVNRLYLEAVGDLGQLTVTEEEIETYYREHPGQFRRPESRLLYHLFVRHADPAAPQATLAEVAELREQLLAGASFETLARRHSDSETASQGGALGWVQRGTLPADLERAAFALANGEISPPLPVSGGVVLFKASEVIPAKDFSLPEVRDQIGARLLADKRQAHLEELVADVTPSGGDVVLDQEGFAEAAAAGDADRVVLRFEGFELTWRELASRSEGSTPRWQDYRRQIVPRMLYSKAVAEGFLERPEVRRRIAEMLRVADETRRVEAALEERLRSPDLVTEQVLSQFHSDHQQLYQTAGRLLLRRLAIPLTSDPARLSRVLAARVAAVERGEASLDEVAAALDGELHPEAWYGPDLGGLDVKTARQVLQVRDTGFTLPYRLGEDLWLAQVVEREAPRPLSFDEVRDRVREDYVARHAQELYEQVAEAVLAAADYRYLEERVAKTLALE